MRQFFIPIFLCILLPLKSKAASRHIDIIYEIETALVVDDVKIIGYNRDEILYQYMDTTEIHCAKLKTEWKDIWPWAWPSNNDSLLIVVDKNEYVSLFAKKEKTDYKFWDPQGRHGVPIFYFEDPVKPLSGKNCKNKLPKYINRALPKYKEQTENDEVIINDESEPVKNKRCVASGGCLFPITELKKYKVAKRIS